MAQNKKPAPTPVSLGEKSKAMALRTLSNQGCEQVIGEIHLPRAFPRIHLNLLPLSFHIASPQNCKTTTLPGLRPPPFCGTMGWQSPGARPGLFVQLRNPTGVKMDLTEHGLCGIYSKGHYAPLPRR